MTTKPRNPESGYALLFVFAMSAIVAIGLYEQLPRAAFEAQRDKEALLIMHGQQYIRGVQLYVRKLGKYPAKMEDLDNTQNIRFLRKHYIDPMTGKDEWRLLHMGPNGKLIDSKIKTQDPNADQWHQGSITEFKSASSDDGDILNANVGTRKRPSDEQGQPPMQGGTPSGGAPDPALLASGAPGGSAPGAAALPGMPPGQRGTNPQAPGGTAPNQNSGSPTAAGNQSSVSGNGGFGSVAGNGGYGPPANNTAGTPGQQPPPGQGNAAGPGGQPYGTAPGSNMNPQTGFGQQGGQTSASSMINNLLTQPRPGGAPTNATPGIGGTVMGGLAGVASTYKGRGIKRYKDQEEYPKWEFFYDLAAEQASAVRAQANQMNTGSGLQGNQANQPGQSGFGGTPSSFGQSSFGQSSFGQSPANAPSNGSTMGSPASPRTQ